jgi:ABC-type transport system substrate-binding protein
VTFWDGKPFTSADVVYTFRRVLDPKTGSEGLSQMTFLKPGGIKADGPYRVKFTTAKPVAELPLLITNKNTFIVQNGAKTATLRTKGAGTGPFIPVGFKPGKQVQTFNRNPNYWQKGLPYLDKLEFRPLSDTESRYASIQNGDVDIIYGAFNEELVRAVQDENLAVYYGEQNGGELLYFNFDRPPFDDRRMREAVVRAIDLDALSAVHYGNQIVPADSLFTTDSPYHDDAASTLWPTHDPTRAKQLVDEYRASGGNPDFVLKTVNTWLDFAAFIQAQMATVGITVKVEVYDLAQYASQVVQSGDFDLSTTVGSFDNPYPGAVRLLSSTGNQNYGKYDNPKVDDLLDQAAGTVDETQRQADYREVEKIVNEDLVFCWLSRSFVSTITRNDVKGVVRYLFRDMYFATLWLDR